MKVGVGEFSLTVWDDNDEAIVRFDGGAFGLVVCKCPYDKFEKAAEEVAIVSIPFRDEGPFFVFRAQDLIERGIFEAEMRKATEMYSKDYLAVVGEFAGDAENAVLVWIHPHVE